MSGGNKAGYVTSPRTGSASLSLRPSAMVFNSGETRFTC